MEFTRAVQFYSSSLSVLLDGSIRSPRASLAANEQKFHSLLPYDASNAKLTFTFVPCSIESLNLKCQLIAGLYGIRFEIDRNNDLGCKFPILINKIEQSNKIIVGSNSICKYIQMKSSKLNATSSSSSRSSINEFASEILDIEEVNINPLLRNYRQNNNESDKKKLLTSLEYLESKIDIITSDVFIALTIYPTLRLALELFQENNLSNLKNLVTNISQAPLVNSLSKINLNANSVPVPVPVPIVSTITLSDNIDEVGLVRSNNY